MDPDNGVIFLADCGPKIGLGHLRRSLVLAAAFRRRRYNVRFLLTAMEGERFIFDAGFPGELWRGNVEVFPAAVVVIDGYQFDASLASQWRERTGAMIIVIDDLGDKPVDADVILNHNLYGAELDYSAYRARKILAGPQFALIDSEFAEIASKLRPSSPHVVVSFGGTDDGRYGVPAALAVLERHSRVVVDLVIAPRLTRDTIQSDLVSRFLERCRVHYGASMVGRMADAHLYLGAAGVTVMEAIAAGVDVVACAIAVNQQINIRTLAKLGYPAFDEFEPGAMSNAVISRLSDARVSQSSLIDGAGANRVVDQVMRMRGNPGEKKDASIPAKGN